MYTCFPDVTNADRRVRFTTSLLKAVTFTRIDRCVYAGRGLVPRCINLDAAWGEGGENDVENTGINHSDDGKVKTDRSFTFPRFTATRTHSISKLRVLIRNGYDR